MKNIPITREGYSQLKDEIKKLKNEDRVQVIKDISIAREFGDLSENAEYKAAKEKQNLIEKRILELERVLSNCQIIDTQKLSNDTVKFGAFVKIMSLDDHNVHSYQIVGEYESNLKKEKISIMSPIAKSLVKKSVGDAIEVHTPKGVKFFEILAINY